MNRDEDRRTRAPSSSQSDSSHTGQTRGSAHEGAADDSGASTGQLHELVSRLLNSDGTLNAREATQLTRLLSASRELRQEYRRQAAIHAALLWTYHGVAGRPRVDIDPLAIADLIDEANQEAAAKGERVVPSVAPRADQHPRTVRKWRSVNAVGLGCVAAAAVALVVSLSRHGDEGTRGQTTSPLSGQSSVAGAAGQAPESDGPPRIAAGRIVRSVGCEWADETRGSQPTAQGQTAQGRSVPSSFPTLREGSVLYQNDRWRLEQGYAEIATSRGALVAIKSPCEIELTGDNRLRLIKGGVIGLCKSKRSRGLTIDTKSLSVTDIGTEFGIWVGDDYAVLTEVFEGSVVTSAKGQGNAGQSRKLFRGQSLAVDAAGQSIPVERLRLTAPFNGLAAARVGAVSVSAGCTYRPTAPRAIPAAVSSGRDEVLLIQEFAGDINLTADVPLTLSTPGDHMQFNGPGRSGVVPARTKVRSFVLYADGLDGEQAGEHVELTGEISFAVEILGVIARPGHWDDFLAAAPSRAVRNDSNSHYLLEDEHATKTPRAAYDVIGISEDKRTLKYEFNVMGEGCDAVRVLLKVP